MNKVLLFCTLLLLPFAATAQRQRSTTWESGVLEKGEKVGEWEYYSYSALGERVVTQRYDHTANKLVYCRPDDKLYKAEVSRGRWESIQLTQPPWFIGGHEALAAYTSKLRYPPAAEARNVQGRVVVSFVVDTLGHLSDYQVVRGIGSGCDEEALRVARTVPDQWLPGRLGTKALPVVYELPFTFRLK
ncbi:energy transducer TonB [Hymenobacter sp. BT664]|uniref:Energy transducer TonB n=1 Tax=Hymenobacter montanus TaxID=2771359 RepID=A0A927BAY3_9BACT|nr:energy transducer TonB [Hymenobacter montanus]MBD2767405.1 energy transducer TonB [Hymenobacter montanus]